MSGRRSVSTRTGTNRSPINAATSGSAYVVRSISWHARHHAAVIDSSTGLASRAARSNASACQGSHSTMPRLCVRRGRGTIAGMLLLRYLSLLALVVWVGGLVALGSIAAPATFDVMAARHVADGRALAGAVFGEALRRFFVMSLGAAAVVLLSLTLRRVLGPKPRHFGWRAGVLILMTAASVYAGVVVAGRIATLQASMGVAPSSLPESDPRRIEFGRLHATSTALQLVPLVGGLALIFWELKE